MKKLVLFTLLCLGLPALAQTYSTINWGLENWNVGAPAKNATVITPVGPTPTIDGNYPVIGLPVRYPNTNNSAWSVQLRPSNYRLDIEGAPAKKPIYFQSYGDGQTYGLSDVLLSGGNIFAVTGARRLTSNDHSVTLNPANGTGVVDLSGAGGSTNVMYSGQIGCYQDANLSTGGGHDDTATIQKALDQSTNGPIELVIEKVCSVTGYTVRSNTVLRGLPGAGFYTSASGLQPLVVGTNIVIKDLTFNFNHRFGGSGGQVGDIRVTGDNVSLMRLRLLNPAGLGVWLYQTGAVMHGSITVRDVATVSATAHPTVYTTAFLVSGAWDNVSFENVSVSGAGLDGGIVQISPGYSVQDGPFTLGTLSVRGLYVNSTCTRNPAQWGLVQFLSIDAGAPSSIGNLRISDVSSLNNQGVGIGTVSPGFDSMYITNLSFNGCSGITNTLLGAANLTVNHQGGSDFLRSGVLALGAAATTHSVIFSTPMPTTTYGVALAPEFAPGTLTWYVSTKATTGFTITTSDVPGSGKSLDWHVAAPQ